MAPGEVIITRKLGEALKAFFDEKTFSNVGILMDENTKIHCYPLVRDLLPDHLAIAIESGEENKSLKTCESIWQQLTEARFDRKSLLINLGGGVIGDMGGFCAATFKRGIDFINLPTTLLAQVDASVGGKLGIDFQGLKNHIGLFKLPVQVIICDQFLDTLPYDQLRSGFAEVIKHHLIRDREGWPSLIQSSLSDISWYDIIKHSVDIKQKIVDEDPLEQGARKILNFGHTIGHAVESFYLNQADKQLLHGEAIAVGMIAESYLSVLKNGMDKSHYNQIIEYLIDLYNPRAIYHEDIKAIAHLTTQDKKNIGSTVKCTLLKQIGEANYDITLGQEEICHALNEYNETLAKHHK